MAKRYDDPEPSSAYDDCHTTEEIEARYQELFTTAQVDLGLDGDERLPHAVTMELLGDLRLAHCRKVRERDGLQKPRPGSPFEDTAANERRSRSAVALAPEGAETIECPVCTETLPVTKFPTLSGKPGVREAVCRSCKKATRNAVQK